MSMLHSDNFKLAYRSLRAAKARSFLTMLGIIIGVAAVVLVVCLGQGVKQQIAGQLGHFGKDVLAVQPGSESGSAGALAGLAASNTTLLTDHDVRTVQRTGGVAETVPLATTSGTVSGDHTVNDPFIVATSVDFPDIINHPFLFGGFFDADSKSVVLGSNLAQKLFNNNDPLGQGLVWRGQRFIVAGVYERFNAPPFSLEAGFDNAMFVPYTTARNLGGDGLGVYEILARADNAADTSHVVSSTYSALVAAHGGARDVTVKRAVDSNAGSNQTVHLLTLLIAGAAAIALVVGGVGIMDVMLVSVTERMHEIGIRKAVGATNQQIMRQFVAEAFVLSFIGALIGLVLAAAGVGLLRVYTGLQPIIVWQAFVIAPLVAVVIGVFFGSMPALKAARKDPIDALRHE